MGAISVTSKREEVIDFFQPFYESGLQVLIAGGASFADNIFQLIKKLFSQELIGMFLLLVAAMFVISHLVWRYEHKVNADREAVHLAQP